MGTDLLTSDCLAAQTLQLNSGDRVLARRTPLFVSRLQRHASFDYDGEAVLQRLVTLQITPVIALADDREDDWE